MIFRRKQIATKYSLLKRRCCFSFGGFYPKKQDWKEPPVFSGSSSITIIIT
jgi:hypothetical protein